jgi:hypothetical protein
MSRRVRFSFFAGRGRGVWVEVVVVADPGTELDLEKERGFGFGILVVFGFESVVAGVRGVVRVLVPEGLGFRGFSMVFIFFILVFF